MRIYTPQYGYFELRAKGVNTSIDHVALWMIGYEDSPEKSAEICIMEIMGEQVIVYRIRIISARKAEPAEMMQYQERNR